MAKNDLNAEDIGEIVGDLIDEYYDERFTKKIKQGITGNCKIYALNMCRVFMIKMMSKDTLPLYKQYLPNELKSLYDE